MTFKTVSVNSPVDMPDRYVIVYAYVRDGEPVLLNADEAIDFVRQEIYNTNRAPYLHCWQYDTYEDAWMKVDEEWEVSADAE